MKPGKGKGILALLGTAEDEDEPKKSGAPMGEGEEDEDGDEEALDAAQELIDAIESKDAAGVVEAFTRLKDCC